jgi:methionyl-tRNA formyltransferase
MTPRSIIFCGTSAFAVPALQALAADSEFEVQLVITQPDRPVGRKQELTPPPLKVAAEKLSLKLWQPENLNKELTAYRSSLAAADFLIVASYGQLLSEEVLNLPKRLPLNIHASLLPRWRGASPIQQAILANDRETGVTIQKMVKQLDAGPILGQEKTPIDPRETFISLHDRLATMSASLLIQTLKNPLEPQDQDETEITFCHKLTKEDGMVNPEKETAEAIDRKVRALTPWPGVTITMNGQQLKVIETSLAPTTISTRINCDGNSALYLVKVVPAGKKEMTGAEWERGVKGK